jgi:hypothetical protein
MKEKFAPAGPEGECQLINLPPEVDESAQRRRLLLVASEGPWNCYDFPE